MTIDLPSFGHGNAKLKTGPKVKALKERFFARLPTCPDANGCWPWQGSPTVHGYGQISTGSRSDGSHTMAKAHRVSWLIHCGPLPRDLIVRHKCDNRRCVNPVHLELGSMADNNRDMLVRLRAKTRITPNLVQVIHAERRAGARLKELARSHSLSVCTIRLILHGKTWKTRGNDSATVLPPRRRTGGSHPQARLTLDQVREMRSLFLRGETAASLARKFGVTSTTARNIVHYRTWNHPNELL